MLIKRDLAKEPMHALCVCRVFFFFFFTFLVLVCAASDLFRTPWK